MHIQVGAHYQFTVMHTKYIGIIDCNLVSGRERDRERETVVMFV